MRQDPSTGMKCISYMLLTTNFMFAMIGFLLISVGSTITAIYTDFELFVENHFFSPAALLIAIGVIIFFVSLFGCFGAIRKSTCLVNIYSLLLGLILILEISAVIAAYAMRHNISVYTEVKMKDSMNCYETEANIKYDWDFMQNSLKCCGVYSPDDWMSFNVSTISKYPQSCYQNNEESSIWAVGCLNRLSYIIYDCATLIGTGSICVAVVQILGVIFANMLAKSIRRLKTEASVKRENEQRLYAQLARGNAQSTPITYKPESTA